MKKTRISNQGAFAGLFSAIVASLCCITPVLALFSGATGIAATFSWIEPYRPILIGLTLLILGFAWYQRTKPLTQDINCVCGDHKPKFIQSKVFLFFVTIFSGFMLAFPYYSHLFYPNSNIENQVIYVSERNVGELNYSIQGMTCAGCEAHIEHEVNQLEGILEVNADYDTSSTFVKYDRGTITPDEIKTAIGKTGYKIME
ncbi:MAG: mercuric transport protein MerTP [Bacteroidota bacterium]|nr:mercuric transport protein MerTP [Bacteroidota bacterium]